MSVLKDEEGRKVWLYRLIRACDVPEHKEMWEKWLRYKEYERVWTASRRYRWEQHKEYTDLRLLWERNRAEFEWAKRQIGRKDREIARLRRLVDFFYEQHRQAVWPYPCVCDYCAAYHALSIPPKEKKRAKRARKHERLERDRRERELSRQGPIPPQESA